ncbi:MAG: hypothetical protein R2799_16585, partial [Crocinitomicaceae bacterium]
VVWKTLSEDDHNICITSKGCYYLEVLVNRFHYYDMVLQDTPIYSSESFDKIFDSFPKSTPEGKRFLYDRQKCVEYFFEYLRSQFDFQSPRMITNYGEFPSEVLKGGLENDLKRISQLVSSK